MVVLYFLKMLLYFLCLVFLGFLWVLYDESKGWLMGDFMGLENFDLLIFEEDLFFSKLFLILDRSFIFVLIVLVDVDVF